MHMVLERKVQETLAKFEVLSSGDRVLVAVSGGPDSVALLYLLHDLRDELRLHLEVAHLQHGIRGEEAREDARFVAALADRLNLPFHLKEVDVLQIKAAAGKGNLEALAREERYRFFADIARQRRLAKIATAHTEDDQAETVLMWFLRGSGLNGLAGMAPVHPLDRIDAEPENGLVVIRPLLDVSRAEIEAYLNEKHLSFRLDRSNQDSSFLRNWIRLELIPRLKEKTGRSLPSRLARQAELIREEDELLDALAKAALSETRNAEGMDRGSLLRHGKAMQRRLLRLWTEETRGHLRGLDFQHVEALLDLINAGPPQGRLAIPGGWDLVKEYEKLRLEKRSRRLRQQCACYSHELRPGQDLPIREAGLTIVAREILPPLPSPPADLMGVFFDRAFITGKLTLRNFRRGDRFQPLGMIGHKKVKDLFIEKKIPLSVRARLPLLVLGDEVIWIPGYARSEVGRVTPETKAVLNLKAVAIRN
ncbi:MAG TPA: tRNA lysidine(34) synthetase TilS [Candidatus Binatia bacterium]|nr:tRNA lysidine(34) synthetase TilS [Candidatus Binatia bacterium]